MRTTNTRLVIEERSYYTSSRSIWWHDKPYANPGQDAEYAQVEKDQRKVAYGHIEQVAAQRRANRPGDEAVGRKGQPKNCPKVLDAEAVGHQRSGDGRKGAEGKSNHRCQKSTCCEAIRPGKGEIGKAC